MKPQHIKVMEEMAEKLFLKNNKTMEDDFKSGFQAAYELQEERIEVLKHVLEAVRSQMCWERDRDQLTIGFIGLHDAVTNVLAEDSAEGDK